MMTDEARRILEQALALPPEVRVELAEKLYMSMATDAEPPLSEAWRKEIESRIAAYERGEVEMIPAEEVFAELRKKFGCPREQP